MLAITCSLTRKRIKWRKMVSWCWVVKWIYQVDVVEKVTAEAVKKIGMLVNLVWRRKWIRRYVWFNGLSLWKSYHIDKYPILQPHLPICPSSTKTTWTTCIKSILSITAISISEISFTKSRKALKTKPHRYITSYETIEISINNHNQLLDAHENN